VRRLTPPHPPDGGAVNSATCHRERVAACLRADPPADARPLLYDVRLTNDGPQGEGLSTSLSTLRASLDDPSTNRERRRPWHATRSTSACTRGAALRAARIIRYGKVHRERPARADEASREDRRREDDGSDVRPDGRTADPHGRAEPTSASTARCSSAAHWRNGSVTPRDQPAHPYTQAAEPEKKKHHEEEGIGRPPQHTPGAFPCRKPGRMSTAGSLRPMSTRDLPTSREKVRWPNLEMHRLHQSANVGA